MGSRAVVLAIMAGLVGCGGQEIQPALSDAIAGVESPAGAFLAYEHRVVIEVAAERLSERVSAAQAACIDQRIGDCAVLNVEQQSGEWPSAQLTVRIAPEGVEKLLAIAGEGGELTSRSTKAEDLAQAVGDNATERARLEKLNERLEELAARKDLKIDDTLALSREIASVEVQLESLARDAQKLERRIDTNLLAMTFTPPGRDAASNALTDAFEDSGTRFIEGAASLVSVVSYLAPFVLVGAPLFVLVRRWRRRKRES